MKRTPHYLILFIAIIACNASFSQIISLEFNKSVKREVPSYLNFVNDENNARIAIITRFDFYCKLHVIGNGFQIISEVELPLKEKSVFKGGYIRNDSIYLVFFTDTYRETLITSFSYNINTNSFNRKDWDINLYNENVLDVFLIDDYVNVLTLKNDNKGFVIYKYQNGKSARIIQYDFSGKTGNNSKFEGVQSFSLLGAGRPRLIVDIFEPEITLGLGAARKSYILKDSIHILDHFIPGMTNIYSLNLKNNGCSFRKIYNITGIEIVSSPFFSAGCS